MTTYGAQMDRKWTGSGLEVTGSGLEVAGSGPEVDLKCLSVRLYIYPSQTLPYLLDEPYARDLQAQGACALRFFVIELTFLIVPFCPLNFFKDPVRVVQAINCCAQSVKVHSLWSLSHLSHHNKLHTKEKLKSMHIAYLGSMRWGSFFHGVILRLFIKYNSNLANSDSSHYKGSA